MNDDATATIKNQIREFPEAIKIIQRLREAVVVELFSTSLAQRDYREDLFLRVQIMDAMKAEMETILRSGSGDKEAQAYAKSLAPEEQPEVAEKL